MSKAADYTLSWTLDEPNQALWVSVSVPAMFGNSTWVALGFRPLSRSMKPGLLDIGTGHHMNVRGVYIHTRYLYMSNYILYLSHNLYVCL